MRKSAIILASVWCLTIIGGSSTFLSVNAQQPVSNHLPLLLIHGYGEDKHIWDSWIDWLRGNQFDMTKVKALTLPDDDRCGSAETHAIELENQVNSILSATHSDKVNIVAHSKGGLDARWYIAHDNDKVANLIMIGTPNSGTYAAVAAKYGWDFVCPSGSEGLEDLLPTSDAIHASDRPQSTHYYTIAGDLTCLPFMWWLPQGNCLLPGPNDGLVTVHSAQCSPVHCYYPLEEFPYYHLDLLTHKVVYEKVLPILSCGRIVCGHTGGTSSFSPTS